MTALYSSRLQGCWTIKEKEAQGPQPIDSLQQHTELEAKQTLT